MSMDDYARVKQALRDIAMMVDYLKGEYASGDNLTERQKGMRQAYNNVHELIMTDLKKLARRERLLAEEGIDSE